MFINDDSQALVSLRRMEHKHFHALIQQVSEAILGLGEVSGRSTVSAEQLALVSTKLRDELRQHFLDEEPGSCLGEPIARCPGIGPEVDAIEAEHPRLVEQLERLILMTYLVHENDSALVEFRERWSQFRIAFQHHEEKEEQLLKRGLGGDATRW